MEIHVDEETIDVLDKYSNYRPAEPKYIIEAAIRPWTTMVSEAWKKHPGLAEDFMSSIPNIKEGKTSAINIDKQICKDYLTKIAEVNKKLNINIDPVKLTSWVCKLYIKSRAIERLQKTYKRDFGKFKPV